MPWPTNSRTTPKPWASQSSWTAAEMSPSRPPAWHCWIGFLEGGLGGFEEFAVWD